MILQVLYCPNCHGTDIVRHGQTRQGKQRYRCREQPCAGRTFLLDYSYPGQSPVVKEQIVMDKKFKALLPPPRWSSPLHGRALYGPARAGARRRRSVLGGTGGAMDTGVQHASGARHVCGTHVASKTPVTV